MVVQTFFSFYERPPRRPEPCLWPWWKGGAKKPRSVVSSKEPGDIDTVILLTETQDGEDDPTEAIFCQGSERTRIH